jgi:uncharacterized protein YjbJ (UPF0337 family)
VLFRGSATTISELIRSGALPRIVTVSGAPYASRDPEVLRPEPIGCPDVACGQFGNIGAVIIDSTADKASGLANEAAGKAKQGIGNLVGSDKLKAEGAAQELKGDAQKAAGDAKAAVKDAANKTANAINKNL